MSIRNTRVPEVFQPRMDSYSALYSDKMGKNKPFIISVRQEAYYQATKIIAYRLLAVLGATYATVLDLKQWVWMSRNVVKTKGLQFHLVNLISILAFPILALATMPFGYLPRSHLSRGFQSELTPLQYIERYHTADTLTVGEARIAMRRFVSSGTVFDQKFVADSIAAENSVVLRAFVLTIPDRNLPDQQDAKLLRNALKEAVEQSNNLHVERILRVLKSQDESRSCCLEMFNKEMAWSQKAACDAMRLLSNYNVVLDKKFIEDRVKEGNEIALKAFVVTIPDRFPQEPNPDLLKLQNMLQSAVQAKNVQQIQLILKVLDANQKKLVGCSEKFLKVVNRSVAAAEAFIDADVDISNRENRFASPFERWMWGLITSHSAQKAQYTPEEFDEHWEQVGASESKRSFENHKHLLLKKCVAKQPDCFNYKAMQDMLGILDELHTLHKAEISIAEKGKRLNELREGYKKRFGNEVHSYSFLLLNKPFLAVSLLLDNDWTTLPTLLKSFLEHLSKLKEAIDIHKPLFEELRTIQQNAYLARYNAIKDLRHEVGPEAVGTGAPIFPDELTRLTMGYVTRYEPPKETVASPAATTAAAAAAAPQPSEASV